MKTTFLTITGKTVLFLYALFAAYALVFPDTFDQRQQGYIGLSIGLFSLLAIIWGAVRLVKRIEGGKRKT